jgi:hypothetical protein
MPLIVSLSLAELAQSMSARLILSNRREMRGL